MNQYNTDIRIKLGLQAKMTVKPLYKNRNATNLSRFVFYNKLNVINTIDAEKLRNKFFK